MIIETNGLFAILILIADIYAIFNVVPSRKPLGVKAHGLLRSYFYL